jgi:tetratricopeptide (TPR) repeat protein
MRFFYGSFYLIFHLQFTTMRKCIGFITAIFLFTNLCAQQGIDSLRRLLMHAEDTTRINLINRISAKYGASKPDSTLKYANDALTLAKKTNYKKGEIEAMRNLGWAFLLAGDYSKALEYSLEALKKSEVLGDKKLIAGCNNAIGGVYSIQGDYLQALPYVLKNREIYEEIHSDHDVGVALLNTGNTYYNLNQLDSSRIYFNKALEISLRVNDDDLLAAVYLNLGMVNSKMKQYDIAKAYFKQALPTFMTDSNNLFLYSTYYFLGEAFDSTRHYDSAFYYSRLALITANKMNSPVSLADITKQLASLFKRKGRLDSAFVYQEMAMNAKDSLRSQEKEKKIQVLTFNEQLRQMEIAEQKRKDAEARVRNLQLAGIAIFIPSFFFLVLLLAKIKVRSRMIEFLGVLSLLFLFEFIVLLIHPYIGSWTHESQIWMLLILVAIAVVLVPLHRKLEKWMKGRLTAKAKLNQKVESV